MDDELTLADPTHPDAQEAAKATARLLLVIHESPCRKSPHGDAALPADSEKELPCPRT